MLASAPAAPGELTEKITLCTSCHGDNGLPANPAIPIIWGQEFYYLYVQLKDYKAQRRANPVMGGIVADLDKQQMQALAQHFSEQPWPQTGYATPPDAVAPARSGLVAGQCVQCHLGGYEGNSRVPRLAGQQTTYLERTMTEFKTRVRLNSPAKGSLLAGYDDAVIAAMAGYLGGL